MEGRFRVGRGRREEGRSYEEDSNLTHDQSPSKGSEGNLGGVFLKKGRDLEVRTRKKEE